MNATPQGDNSEILTKYFKAKEPVLQSGDKITISIWGHEDLSIGSVNSAFASNEETGKWVVLNNDGEVNLPKIGRIKLSGLNLKEVNYQLETSYSKYIKNPIINVRVLNHYVTVLGEVNKPGKYELDNETIRLVEMLGQAEGLGEYANAKHIKIIRTVNQQPVELITDMSQLISLRDYNVILQPGDVVVVSSNGKKSLDEKLKRATPVAGIITAVALVVSLILK